MDAYVKERLLATVNFHIKLKFSGTFSPMLVAITPRHSPSWNNLNIWLD
ncbi:hypothetical protein DSM3645_10362 [Blastopirellula marina DSM 3645]|uniref:Uncharacterized protein n=1 Tax=Blastopirellula marina DSM 3645 TaxID=314230 RepID=A3ZM13_9BACT|nr:hypothetical protein DSM3645_10362 [Blastopirellula marina DSM 3645]